MHRCCVPHLLATLSLALLMIGAKVCGAAQAIEFTLSDQDNQPHVVKYPTQKVNVFVVADRVGSDQIAGWVTPIYRRYGQEIEIAGIAALPGIPSAFQGLFRREFKKRLAFPVMLDWTGEVARNLGYTKERAQLFVIAPSGRIALSKAGPATERALAEIYEAVDRLQRGEKR